MKLEEHFGQGYMIEESKQLLILTIFTQNRHCCGLEIQYIIITSFINEIIIYYRFFLKEMAKVSAAQAVVDVANEVKVIASTKFEGVVLLLYSVNYGA